MGSKVLKQFLKGFPEDNYNLTVFTNLLDKRSWPLVPWWKGDKHTHCWQGLLSMTKVYPEDPFQFMQYSENIPKVRFPIKPLFLSMTISPLAPSWNPWNWHGKPWKGRSAAGDWLLGLSLLPEWLLNNHRWLTEELPLVPVIFSPLFPQKIWVWEQTDINKAFFSAPSSTVLALRIHSSHLLMNL